jgi:hypothetical protein
MADRDLLYRYLRTPFMLEVSSVPTSTGSWVRRAEFVELPHCRAEATSIIEAIDAADKLRVRRLLELWRAGGVLQLPRGPLPERDVTPELDQLGLGHVFTHFTEHSLDCEADLCMGEN